MVAMVFSESEFKQTSPNGIPALGKTPSPIQIFATLAFFA
jgi:hypothetical protein